jgi:hypothetical protein
MNRRATLGLVLAVLAWATLVAWVALGERGAPPCASGEANPFGTRCAP